MRQIVVRPTGTVQLPDGSSVEAAAPAISLRAMAATVETVSEAPVLRALSVAAPEPAQTALKVQGPAIDTQAVTGFATSVGIQTAGGTVITSTPADLTMGPESNITNFTIVTLDSGSY